MVLAAVCKAECEGLPPGVGRLGGQRDPRRWEHQKIIERKGQMCHLSPMEEKWIYGILTVQAASQFYPFARKDQDKAACFSLGLSRS